MEKQVNTNEEKENLNSFSPKNHQHDFVEKGNYIVCKICGIKRLNLKEVEGKELSIGIKSDGRKYSVRDHRQSWFTPEDWKKLTKVLKPKQLWTAEVLIQTGARINEARHIKEGDRKSTRLNSSHIPLSRMPSSA